MSKLQKQVIEFHQAFHHPIADAPTQIPEGRVRLRARLIAEEFFETLEALFHTSDPSDFEDTKRDVEFIIKRARVNVDLTDLADGLADLDYVVEGTRLEFGIDGDGVADVVHASNMAKLVPCGACAGTGETMDACDSCTSRCVGCLGVGKTSLKNKHGKTVKPDGWTPPDIAGELERQKKEKSLSIVVSGALVLIDAIGTIEHIYDSINDSYPHIISVPDSADRVRKQARDIDLGRMLLDINGDRVHILIEQKTGVR